MNANPTTQEICHEPKPHAPLAVLCSGGMDSGVLLAEALTLYPTVHPIYVRTGATWENTELDYLHRFLQAVQTPVLQQLTILEQPVANVYGPHWSITGADVPDENSPDEAVYLPGRNVLLLVKPIIWCHLHGVPEIAMAPLACNPFADAKPEFFGAFCGALSVALTGSIRVLRPYANFTKEQVIQRAKDMPLQHTFSCIRPVNNMHCGHCNKCAERQKAFRAAGAVDPTTYANG